MRLEDLVARDEDGWVMTSSHKRVFKELDSEDEEFYSCWFFGDNVKGDALLRLRSLNKSGVFSCKKYNKLIRPAFNKGIYCSINRIKLNDCLIPLLQEYNPSYFYASVFDENFEDCALLDKELNVLCYVYLKDLISD